MGTVELNTNRQLVISSHIITYGNGADPMITEQMREEIESMWNEPRAFVLLRKEKCRVVFRITATCEIALTPMDIYQNLDPRNNYFRIEEFAHGNISFVDGLGCNSGYFKIENLYKGSTTAAHEYGHTLGLDHPPDLDFRGKGVPGIMYPRGTWVDAQFQYEPDKPAGVTGGTMHPIYRRVRQDDINLLRLHKLSWENNKAILGEFSNIWHPDHITIGLPDHFG
jgi:hypothetical protein